MAESKEKGELPLTLKGIINDRLHLIREYFEEGEQALIAECQSLLTRTGEADFAPKTFDAHVLEFAAKAHEWLVNLGLEEYEFTLTPAVDGDGRHVLRVRLGKSQKHTK